MSPASVQSWLTVIFCFLSQPKHLLIAVADVAERESEVQYVVLCQSLIMMQYIRLSRPCLRGVSKRTFDLNIYA